MSLILANSTPEDLSASAMGVGVFLGNAHIEMSDFCSLVLYALTNSDLVPRDGKPDPRVALVRIVGRLVIDGGYNPGGSRLVDPMSNPPDVRDIVSLSDGG